MLWLSNRNSTYFYFTPVVSQPYTTWSAAGMFVTQCGFPLLLNDIAWETREHLEYNAFADIHCLPDFLQAIGYKLFGYCSGACDIMRMKDFMRERGYATQDSAEHHRYNDDELFEMLTNEVLPTLAHTTPFALLILNADTHSDFTIGSACDD
jgi:hypothetical protein